MNKVWQPQLCVYHKSFSKVCAAGDVQFKRASVDKVPVHDDAHAAIVSWWHNADQQNAAFNRHEFSSCKGNISGGFAIEFLSAKHQWC
jgi:hypothetical protein